MLSTKFTPSVDNAGFIAKIKLNSEPVDSKCLFCENKTTELTSQNGCANACKL